MLNTKPLRDCLRQISSKNRLQLTVFPSGLTLILILFQDEARSTEYYYHVLISALNMVNVTEESMAINVTSSYDVTSYSFNETAYINDTLSNVTINTNSSENITDRVLTTVTLICRDGLITTQKPQTTTSHDALLYIVVVLLFYAFSMVILMVKYIRREKEEAEMAHYYSEFVSRDRFKTPMFEIRNCMQGLGLKSSSRFSSPTLDDDDDYVSCSEVPLVIKDSKLYIGEETKI